MKKPYGPVYVTIGNSDDKLPQAEWSSFVAAVSHLLNPDGGAELTVNVHGKWFSLQNEPWQNACWCVDFATGSRAATAMMELRKLARIYRQDSIAWAPVASLILLGPLGPDAPDDDEEQR